MIWWHWVIIIWISGSAVEAIVKAWKGKSDD